jgi:hypothetical protein
MKRHSKIIAALVALAISAYLGLDQLPSGQPATTNPTVGQTGNPPTDNERIAAAYRSKDSDVDVSGAGTVTRVLADDNDGSRHQRFILDVQTERTILVAHNIDLAPRLDGLKVGDTVAFKGVYEWNDRGGVVHWTHHDPQNRHSGGWLKHRGRTYQ